MIQPNKSMFQTKLKRRSVFNGCLNSLYFTTCSFADPERLRVGLVPFLCGFPKYSQVLQLVAQFFHALICRPEMRIRVVRQIESVQWLMPNHPVQDIDSDMVAFDDHLPHISNNS